MSALLPVADGRATWAATRRLLRPHRARLLLTSVVMLAAATAALAVPALLGWIVQTATDGGSVGAVAWAAVAIVAACVAGAALDAVGRSLMARVTEASLATLREDVVERVLHLPVAEVEAAGEGDVVSRVSGDVETVGETASGVLPAVTSALFSVVVTLIGLGALDWRFALGALAALPLQILSLRAFRRRTPPVYAQARRAEGERAEALLQAVHGAPTALALHQADAQRAAVERTSRAAISTEMRGVRYVGRFANGSNLAELCGMAGVLVAGYLLVTSGAVGVGAATAAALFFHRLFGPMGVLLFQADDLALAGAGLARLVGVIDGAPTGTRSRSRCAARTSPTTRTARCSPTSRCAWPPASGSRWSAPPAPASPRSPVWSPAPSTPPAAACSSVADPPRRCTATGPGRSCWSTRTCTPSPGRSRTTCAWPTPRPTTTP
jgi:ATP-binding cassette subfamily C protein